MADEKYFQAVSGQWGWRRVATTITGTAEKGCEVDFGPESITFGSNRQNVGYIDKGRAYLGKGLWDSYIEVMAEYDCDDPWGRYLIDVTPVAAFAKPSYIMEGKEIVYHNSVKGTQLVGSSDEGCLIEFDEEEFKDFANQWNARHCEGWVGQTPPQDLPVGTWAYPPEPGGGTRTLFDHRIQNSAIFPPLKNKPVD